MIDIKVEALSDIDKIFGVWKRQTDFHLLNHFLILAKQHIYSCRNKGYPPLLKTYLAKVYVMYQIETTIADSNGKGTFHDFKWKNFFLIIVVHLVADSFSCICFCNNLFFCK